QVRNAKAWISDMKYSRDGSILAVACSNGQIFFHDPKDHYCLKATTGE
ncbi:unnamed protein product, partial [Discosporangium mesarthrocarpum]